MASLVVRVVLILAVLVGFAELGRRYLAAETARRVAVVREADAVAAADELEKARGAAAERAAVTARHLETARAASTRKTAQLEGFRRRLEGITRARPSLVQDKANRALRELLDDVTAPEGHR